MLRRNVFSLLIASLIAVCIVIGCSESEDDVNLLGSADLTQTYARIKDQLIVEDDTLVGIDAAPGAPAACPIDGNTDRFPKNRLLTSYEKFYADFDPVIEDSDQNYAVIVSRYKREQNYMIRVVGLNANLKKKRAGIKYARGFDTCQEAKDFRQLVLDDYNGVNQVAGTQAVSNEWTLHLFRREIADASDVLPHLRQQFKLDIQVVPPNGTPLSKAGYTRYDLFGYDETATYATEQAAREKRKELLLDYTRGSDTKQGGYVIYFFQIATEGFPFDAWEIKGENSRPWIQGGRWVDADVSGTQITSDGVFVFQGTKHECGKKTVNIDIGRTPDYVERGLGVDDPDGVLSSINPNEIDVNGNGIWDQRDTDRNDNGDLDQGDIIFGQYRNADGTKKTDFGDKRDVRVISLFDKDDDGNIEVSDLDNNNNNRVDDTEVFRYFHGVDVFVPRDPDKYCDKVVHFEYFPKWKEGIRGEIWARHRLYTWLEFGE